MKNLKDITVLFWDEGLFSDLAVRMARDVKKVYYYVPNMDLLPTVDNTMIGSGLEGVEVTSSPWSLLHKIDLCVFPYTGFGDIQNYIRDQGIPVWGTGSGEELELDRELCKEVLDEIGLPVGPYQVVKGISKLRKVLKEKKDQYVKISRFRGMGESFFSKDYKSIEPKLDRLEFKLGPLKETQNFDVEQSLPDKIEVGSDMYSVDGELPSRALFGVEVKDAAYVGMIKDRKDFPKPLQVVDDALAPIMKDYGYRMFYSTECRIGKDQKPYMIDFTARCAFPPWQLYCEMYKNISEIIWKGANGELIDPEPLAKYGALVMLKSHWAADENWTPIDIPDDIRQFVKITAGCKIGNQYYSVPIWQGLEEVGAVIGMGDSMESAIKQCKDRASQIGGVDIKANVEAFEKADEIIGEAKEYGIELFS